VAYSRNQPPEDDQEPRQSIARHFGARQTSGKRAMPDSRRRSWLDPDQGDDRPRHAASTRARRDQSSWDRAKAGVPRASQLEPDQCISGRDAHVAGFWDVGGVASATLVGFPRRKSLPGVIGTGGRLDTPRHRLGAGYTSPFASSACLPKIVRCNLRWRSSHWPSRPSTFSSR
jgi:hypothetical protein